jgi:hypothetical protein
LCERSRKLQGTWSSLFSMRRSPAVTCRRRSDISVCPDGAMSCKIFPEPERLGMTWSCLVCPCVSKLQPTSDHPSDLMRQFKSAACSPTPVRSTCLMEWMNLMPTLSGFRPGFQSAIKPSRPKALFLQRFPKLAANPVRPLLTDERTTSLLILRGTHKSGRNKRV